MELNALKDRYGIWEAWDDLALPGEPGKCCRSPFPALHKHGDANPSFSVFADGKKWKDHATGLGGDIFDLIAKVRECDMAQAIRFVEDRLGITRPAPTPKTLPQQKPSPPRLRPG